MYAENSDRTLEYVVPITHNATGKVIRWDIGCEYVFPAVGYTTSSAAFTTTVYTNVGVSTYNLEPTLFTAATLLSIASDNLNDEFEYAYLMEFDLHETDSRTVQVGFGITQLAS